MFQLERFKGDFDVNEMISMNSIIWVRERVQFFISFLHIQMPYLSINKLHSLKNKKLCSFFNSDIYIIFLYVKIELIQVEA